MYDFNNNHHEKQESSQQEREKSSQQEKEKSSQYGNIRKNINEKLNNIPHISEDYAKSRTRFINFNTQVILFTSLLGLVSWIIPHRKTPLIKSPFIVNHILPMIFFIIFSFLFGGIFILGDYEIQGFLKYYFKDRLLDIGIIAAYFGLISIIISIFLRNIIEDIIGIKIESAAIYDIIGFVLGRLLLLFVIYITE